MIPQVNTPKEALYSTRTLNTSTTTHQHRLGKWTLTQYPIYKNKAWAGRYFSESSKRKDVDELFIIIIQPQKMIKAAVVVVTPVFLQVLVLWKRLDWFPLLVKGCSHLRNSLRRAEQQKHSIFWGHFTPISPDLIRLNICKLAYLLHLYHRGSHFFFFFLNIVDELLSEAAVGDEASVTVCEVLRYQLSI